MERKQTDIWLLDVSWSSVCWLIVEVVCVGQIFNYISVPFFLYLKTEVSQKERLTFKPNKMT